MPQPLSARVDYRAQRPTLIINDVAYPPLIYALTDCPGARWTWEEVPARNLEIFAQHGIRLFQVNLWYEQIVDPETNRLDLTLARRQVAGVLDVCPDAAVMIRLHVIAPRWWCHQHPHECVGYADAPVNDAVPWGLRRPLVGDAGTPLRASFASKVWRDWASEHLATFCRELGHTPEGAAVFSIQIANGLYGEWHQFGFLEHDPDVGGAMTDAYRAYLRERYKDDAGLARAWNQPDARLDEVLPPGTPEREVADLGILRDPKLRQPVIDYYGALHHELAESVLTLAAVAKRHWPRPLVTAAFFGYFYGVFGRGAAGGHLSWERALNSPELDCLCSPQSYLASVRGVGGTGHARGLMDPVRRAGKLWLDEMDQPTRHGGCPWDRTFTSTLEQDIAVHRRNVLQPVTRGGGQWWFDFGPTACTPSFGDAGNWGWWDDPDLLRDIRAIHDLVKARLDRPYTRPADVLVIHDPWSFAHTLSKRIPPQKEFGGQLPDAGDPITLKLLDPLAEALHRSGLIHEEALLSELPTLDLQPYRLVIFATTPVLTAEQREMITQRVAHSGRHLVLLAYSGWSDGVTLDPARAGAWSGLGTHAVPQNVPRQQLQLDGLTDENGVDGGWQVPAYSVENDNVVGRWADGTPSAVYRVRGEATWWALALPPTSPILWRALGGRAGCQVVNEGDDTTFLGDGLLVVHTRDGGERILRPPGAPEIRTTLPPCSTWVWEVATGELLLGPLPEPATSC